MTLIAIVNDDAIEWGWGDYDVIAITPETRSRKAFKAFIEANSDTPCLIDPSVRFFGAHNDQRTFTPREAIERARQNPQKDLIVTNHPRRTWFGTLIEKDGVVTFKEK